MPTPCDCKYDRTRTASRFVQASGRCVNDTPVSRLPATVGRLLSTVLPVSTIGRPMTQRMPRPKSTNTLQVTLQLPEDAGDRATALAPRIGVPGVLLTRAEVLRVAVLRGLDVLEAEHPDTKRRRG